MKKTKKIELYKDRVLQLGIKICNLEDKWEYETAQEMYRVYKTIGEKIEEGIFSFDDELGQTFTKNFMKKDLDEQIQTFLTGRRLIAQGKISDISKDFI